ncbi:MAG: fumarylacetoacetate hydrolase family protein [Dehalococcoidia bacterium]|nr:fumarylacetoacetate hydrolase family protein [Dehalococcoidia bacterium]
MRLRRVRLSADNTFSVAIEQMQSWVPVRPALALYQTLTSKSLPELDAASGDIISFLQGGDEIRRQATMLLDFTHDQEVSWDTAFDPSPLLLFQPLSFRDFMLYEKHAIDAGRGLVKRFLPRTDKLLRIYEFLRHKPHSRLHPKKIWYEKPIYYMGNHLSFFTDGEHIPWPSYSQCLDYELELGIVVARPICNATLEQGIEAIGGFTVINDFSARDVQYPEMTSGFGPVKSKNFANAMGLELVTADEILPHVDNLNVKVAVNGQIWGSGNTKGMQHSIAAMVAYASLGELLRPGELLATGTIPGCSGVEVGRWLSPGDEIELWIERVGTLKNITISSEV